MKNKVTLNRKRRLFVIPEGNGYTCLGFDVCQNRINRLAPELAALGYRVGRMPRKGTLAQYHHLRDLQELARKQHEATGWRSQAELTPQLIGLEGKRVEVVSKWPKSGAVERERFWVGKSTGWIPCHLSIARRNCHGGPAVCLGEIQSVRVINC